MTLENVSNIEGLFEIISSCKGNVELVSSEGDKINLKSSLAQYLAVAGVFSDGCARELEFNIEDPDDMKKILDFIVSGQSVE